MAIKAEDLIWKKDDYSNVAGRCYDLINIKADPDNRVIGWVVRTNFPGSPWFPHGQPNPPYMSLIEAMAFEINRVTSTDHEAKD